MPNQNIIFDDNINGSVYNITYYGMKHSYMFKFVLNIVWLLIPTKYARLEDWDIMLPKFFYGISFQLTIRSLYQCLQNCINTNVYILLHYYWRNDGRKEKLDYFTLCYTFSVHGVCRFLAQYPMEPLTFEVSGVKSTDPGSLPSTLTLATLSTVNWTAITVTGFVKSTSRKTSPDGCNANPVGLKALISSSVPTMSDECSVARFCISSFPSTCLDVPSSQPVRN